MTMNYVDNEWFKGCSTDRVLEWYDGPLVYIVRTPDPEAHWLVMACADEEELYTLLTTEQLKRFTSGQMSTFDIYLDPDVATNRVLDLHGEEVWRGADIPDEYLADGPMQVNWDSMEDEWDSRVYGAEDTV